MTSHAERDNSTVPPLAGLARPSHETEIVGQFALGIAHDFNNVLAVILANARSLEEQYATPALVPEELRDVIASANLGADMVRRLISFVRQQPIDGVPFDIGTMALGLPQRLRRLLPEDVRLKVDCEDATLVVRADAAAIEQVITNLVTNARDAMPGGGTLRLSIRAGERSGGPDACGTIMPAGEYVAITVRDTGVGIDDRTRHRIFEPFFTTKPVGEGAGLGLAMTYAVVRQLGGYVEVVSTVGVGTTMIVSLPMLTADHHDTEALR